MVPGPRPPAVGRTRVCRASGLPQPPARHRTVGTIRADHVPCAPAQRCARLRRTHTSRRPVFRLAAGREPGPAPELATTRRAEQARRPRAACAHPAESEVGRSRRELSDPATLIHRFSVAERDRLANTFLINCAQHARDSPSVSPGLCTLDPAGTAAMSHRPSPPNLDTPDPPRRRSRPSGEWASAGTACRLRC